MSSWVQHSSRLTWFLEQSVDADSVLNPLVGCISIGIRGRFGLSWWTARLSDRFAEFSHSDRAPVDFDVAVAMDLPAAEAIYRGHPVPSDSLLVSGRRDLLDAFFQAYLTGESRAVSKARLRLSPSRQRAAFAAAVG